MNLRKPFIKQTVQNGYDLLHFSHISNRTKSLKPHSCKTRFIDLTPSYASPLFSLRVVTTRTHSKWMVASMIVVTRMGDNWVSLANDEILGWARTGHMNLGWGFWREGCRLDLDWCRRLVKSGLILLRNVIYLGWLARSSFISVLQEDISGLDVAVLDNNEIGPMFSREPMINDTTHVSSVPVIKALHAFKTSLKISFKNN